MRFSPSGFLKFALLLFLATVCLHAQTFRGGVNGTVTDPSGSSGCRGECGGDELRNGRVL